MIDLIKLNLQARSDSAGTTQFVGAVYLYSTRATESEARQDEFVK
jgi:hypothetical protein